MGIVARVDIKKFPEQSDYVGKRLRVCFQCADSHAIGGVVVRDDLDAPHVMIIRLADGRHVLATECQCSWEPE